MAVKKRFAGLMVSLAILLLPACGSATIQAEPNTLSAADIAVVDGQKTAVSYGMSQEDVEKALGKGEKGFASFLEYPDGLTVMYRDQDGKNVTAGVMFTDDSKYSTPRGISLGASVQDVLTAYGDKPSFQTDSGITYQYDLENARLVTSVEEQPLHVEGSEKTLAVTFIIKNNVVSTITLTDYRMAKYVL